MNNKYIPKMLKDKLSIFLEYSYATFLLLVSISLFISLITFNINDNSLLSSTNEATKNLLGGIGSFISSFVFYTFGIMGYLFSLFFFIYSIQVFFKNNPKYLFMEYYKQNLFDIIII